MMATEQHNGKDAASDAADYATLGATAKAGGPPETSGTALSKMQRALAYMGEAAASGEFEGATSMDFAAISQDKTVAFVELMKQLGFAPTEPLKTSTMAVAKKVFFMVLILMCFMRTTSINTVLHFTVF